MMLFATSAFAWAQEGGAVSAGTLQRLEGHTPSQVLDGSAVQTGRYDPTRMLRLAIALRPPHLAEEKKFVEAVQDAHSPLFHKYLTRDEWRERFAPAAEDEQAVVDWAESQGLKVSHRFANRLVVDIEAPAGAIERALGVTLNSYRVTEDGEGRTAYSNDRDPLLPARLAPLVQFIAGLNSIELARPGGSGKTPAMPDYVSGPPRQEGESMKADAERERANAASPNVQTPPAGLLSPTQILSSQAYDYQALMNLGHCCNPEGQAQNSPLQSSIAIATSGIVSVSDMQSFHAAFPSLAYNIATFLIDGTYTCNDAPKAPDSSCLETTMDTQWTTATANSQDTSADTAKVYVYEGVNSNTSTFEDVFTFMLNDGYARVASHSWGLPETTSGTVANYAQSLDNTFTEMAGEGWTIVVATGDGGSTIGCGNSLDPSTPATDPNAIAVGGTLLTGSTFSGYEVAWTGGTAPGSCASNNGGSGGGFSNLFGTPSYQSLLGLPSRAVPDMALDAAAGQDVYYGGNWVFGGGTSIATPMLAGFFAQENAYLLALGNACGAQGQSPCSPIGNANFAIYKEGTFPLAFHNPFYDITQGCSSNDITAQFGLTPFCAGLGYDEVTGWGSANMLQLAWALNKQMTSSDGSPTVQFEGAVPDAWTNSDQVVYYTAIDLQGDNGLPPTGIAGTTVQWDAPILDSFSEPHGGSGDAFYTGPAVPIDTAGCISFSGTDCPNNSSSIQGVQGCHLVWAKAWNNQGATNYFQSFGPICYDTVAPQVTVANAPTPPSSNWYNSPVTVTLSAVDPGFPQTGSGVTKVYYGLNSTGCSIPSPFACFTYSNPIKISAQGVTTINAFTEDKAGNWSQTAQDIVQIDTTAPKTVPSFTGPQTGGTWTGTVTITLNATDNLSGVAATYYKLDGGPQATYFAPIMVSWVGAHKIVVWSVDLAGNVEKAGTTTWTIDSTTSISLQVSPSPSIAGSQVMIKAFVVPAIYGSNPAGSVTFYDGGALLGEAKIVNGYGELTTSSLGVGTNTLTATFNPGIGFLGSTSAPVQQTVLRATNTLISASPIKVYFGQSFNLFTQVSAPGYSTPTGSVQFFSTKNQLTPLGTVQLNGGVAELDVTSPPAGYWSIYAVYSGDANDGTSKSSPFLVTVQRAQPTVKLVAPTGTILYGELVDFFANVTSSAGTPSGTVAFKTYNSRIGSTETLATVLLSGGSASAGAMLPLGENFVTATYSGDGNFTPVGSGAQIVNVSEKTTTELSPSASSISSGSSITLAAMVIGTPQVVNSGSVTFFSGTSKLGTANVTGGQAQLTTKALPKGSDSLTATFNGAPYEQPSTSTAVTVTVN
jgi:hypothetical protein